MSYQRIKKQDKQIFSLLTGEEKRQQDGLELIPSENYVSAAVKEALGSVFTNKYSEGYPGRRYYGGQIFTDQIEVLAIERAKKIFKAGFANVQPLSGAPANIATYFALLKPGDTILGMDLSHGGHLTHGHPITIMSKIFRFVRYKMKDVETGEIDYREFEKIAKREKPKIILAGFSAYSRELDYEKISAIAKKVGAISVCDIAHIAGLIAGKVHKNPFDYGFDIITSTTHKTLRGPRGGIILTKDNEEYAKKIDKAVFPGLQGGPHMNIIAAKAVAFGEALSPKFKTYAKQILNNAKAMEKVFKRYEVKMIGGGTSNHLILIDAVTSFGISGEEAEILLDEIGLTVNRNVIADDIRSPLDPSGVRLGTPAITTRGFEEEESQIIAEAIVATLQEHTNKKLRASLKKEITSLARRHPVPEIFNLD